MAATDPLPREPEESPDAAHPAHETVSPSTPSPDEPTADPVAEHVIARLRGERVRRPDRPWVAMSMVSSLDGGTAIDGVSGGLGNDTDRAVLRAMRAAADVIIVGAATVRAESYSAPKRASLQLVVVSASLDFQWDDPLWRAPNVCVLTTLEAQAPPSHVRVLRYGSGRVDIPAALKSLKGDVVVSEGGPSLNGQLLVADLVDEIVLTVAPFAVAGRSSRVAHAPEATARRFTLRSVERDGDWLFLRQLRDRDRERN